VLQERVVEPLGGSPRPIDVRVIATTAVDLFGRVERGAFRQDLYYRLAVVTLEVPPLRARLEELEELTTTLMQTVAQRAGVGLRGLGQGTLARLAQHPWPGNLRELENALERVLVLGAGQRSPIAPEEFDFLRRDGLSELERLAHSALGAGLTVEELERALITAAVGAERGNLSAAARRVGLSRRALQYRLRRGQMNGPRAEEQR